MLVLPQLFPFICDGKYGVVSPLTLSVRQCQGCHGYLHALLMTVLDSTVPKNLFQVHLLAMCLTEIQSFPFMFLSAGTGFMNAVTELYRESLIETLLHNNLLSVTLDLS